MSFAAIVAMSGDAVAQGVTLTMLTDVSPEVLARAEVLVEEFEAANPDISIEIETKPGGTEGDNLVKTRLATGTMTDLFVYNSGSLFRAINPDKFWWT
ncbi:hypothetical protein N8D56_25265 (plasmid) [Devosia sp. A8/3-2]|nr:hypothetical protein N8D56_25265 [Devosia sp. A8/3-2]